MANKTHIQPADLRGMGRLTIDAITGITNLVETLHQTISRAPGPLGKVAPQPTRGITRLVYRGIRGVNTLVGGALDTLLAPLAALGGEAESSRSREAILAALNGMFGDYLEKTENPLAIAMRIRRHGQPLELQQAALATIDPEPSRKLLVLVHGLCMNDLQWSQHTATPVPGQLGGANKGSVEQLASEIGYTTLHLHYNSGRHISSNGREFADLLELLVRQWPEPVSELAIVAHSMGGLISRSASHYAELAGHDWRRKLRRLVFLGTPHHGAPLERGGNWLDTLLGTSPYSAPFASLGKVRSAGVTDLRYGNLRDEDWEGRDRFAHTGDHRQPLPLPAHVHCYALAASRGKPPPVHGGRRRGDGLVPVASALGQHANPLLALGIPESNQSICYGLNHLDLLHEAAVAIQVQEWLGPRH